MADKAESTTLTARRRWLIAIAAGLGLYLLALDSSVNVALPTITDAFGVRITTVQWIIILYLSTSAGLVVGLGAAADLFGLRRVFILGLGCYTLAVLLIGLSPNLYAIFGLRLLQAVGAGMGQATAPAIVGRAFPIEQRGRGMGVATAGMALGMVTGTLGGGVLVDALGWQAIFLGRVPVGVVALALAWLTVPGGDGRGGQRRMDLLGAGSLLGGLVAAVLALSLGRTSGWTSPLVLGLAAGGAVAFAVFLRTEARAPWPVFDLSLARLRPYAALASTTFLNFLGIFVIWFIFPFFVSGPLGQGPLVLGLLMAILGGHQSVASLLSGRLADRIPPYYIATGGLVLVALGLLGMSGLDSGASVSGVGVRIALVGIGLGSYMATLLTHVVNTVPRERLATATAGLSLSQSLGSVCSVALASTLFTASQDAHGGAFVPAFRETFRLAALVVGIAAVTSVAAWWTKSPQHPPQSETSAPDSLSIG